MHDVYAYHPCLLIVDSAGHRSWYTISFCLHLVHHCLNQISVSTVHFHFCISSIPLQFAAIVQGDVESVNDELLQATIILHSQAVEGFAIQAEAGRLIFDTENDELSNWLLDLMVALDLIVSDLQAGTRGRKG